MDKFILQEVAYNNGYEKGYADGFAEASPKMGFWKWTKDGDRVCSECGMLEPDCLPGACAIHKPEKRFCFFCGARLIYPEEQ